MNMERDLFGGPRRDRTYDPMIKSHKVYYFTKLDATRSLFTYQLVSTIIHSTKQHQIS